MRLGAMVAYRTTERYAHTLVVATFPHRWQRRPWKVAIMSDISSIVTTVVTVYALLMGIFLVSENRSPQATPWMLAVLLVPGLGVLIYFLFGRDTKAFSRQHTLLRQDLAAKALPVLSPILSR